MKYLERAAFVILFVPLALIASITFVLSLVAVVPGLVYLFLTRGPESADKFLDWWTDSVSGRVLLRAPVFVWLQSIQRRNLKRTDGHEA